MRTVKMASLGEDPARKSPNSSSPGLRSAGENRPFRPIPPGIRENRPANAEKYGKFAKTQTVNSRIFSPPTRKLTPTPAGKAGSLPSSAYPPPTKEISPTFFRFSATPLLPAPPTPRLPPGHHPHQIKTKKN